MVGETTRARGIEAYSLKVESFDGGSIVGQNIRTLLQRITETAKTDSLQLLLEAVVVPVTIKATLHYSLHDGIKAKA